MAKRKQKIDWFPKWARWTLAGAVVLIIGWYVFDGIFGETLRVNAAIRRLGSDRVVDAKDDIRRMGTPALPRLTSALLSGGRDFEVQQTLSAVLLVEPFYAQDAILAAMKSEDPIIRRAAASAMLLGYWDQNQKAERLEDGILEVLADWCREPLDPWLPQALGLLSLYKDPRIVDLVLPLAEMEPTGTPEERARLEESRFRAVRRLSPFAKDEPVAAALQKILEREDESPRIRREAVGSLTAGGQGDPSAYWTAVRSGTDFEREAVADRLVAVRDHRVLPVLEYLLGDASDSVRRAALRTLVRKRAPLVMKDIDYLVEDEFYGIRADLAMAVGQYRERERIPFLIRMLRDFDPEVVRPAYVELVRMTKNHHGFTEIAWTTWKRLPPGEQAQKIKDFLNNEKRREAAIAEWVKVYPPAPEERDRVPHLIRMLAHRSSGNVERAMKELIRLTNRREGFPAELIDGGVPIVKSAEARLRFMSSDRKKLAAEWAEWWKK